MKDKTSAKTVRIKQALIVAGVGASFVVFVLVLQSFSGPQPSTDSSQQTGNNPQGNTSTNTVANENNLKTPEEGTDFSPLLNVGAKSPYIDGLQFALYQYANPKGISVRNATVLEDGVTHMLPDVSGNGPYHTYEFFVKLDSSHTFKTQLRALTAHEIQIILYDQSNNAQLYDSGKIDTRNL